MKNSNNISIALLGNPNPLWANRKELADCGFDVVETISTETLARVDIVLADPKAWNREKRRLRIKASPRLPVILVADKGEWAEKTKDGIVVIDSNTPAELAVALIRKTASAARLRRENADLERHVDNLTLAARQLTESLEKTYSALILSQRINSESIESQVFGRLGEDFLRIFDSCAWGLAWREEGKFNVEFYISRRMRPTTIRDVVRKIRKEFSLHTGDSLKNVKTELDVHAKNCRNAPGKHCKGMLASPMLIGGRVRGTVFAFSRTTEQYNFREAELFSMLANQIAAVFENSRLYGEVKRLSITDELTGLFNRRRLNAVLGSECRRARRIKSPLAFMMLDIDGFKVVNDTYGHNVGDVLLTTLSNLIKSSVRGTDIVGRWGGEEFLLILPSTNINGAMKLAEKVRHNVELKKFRCEGHTVRITVSIGVTTYDPVIDKDPLGVMKRVDVLLYVAKESGRNCVKSV